jgi:hypothetical protein
MSRRMMVVLLAIWPVGGQAAARPTRHVTFTGCVQQTGSAREFLLTVPAEMPEAVRGIAEGQPVPKRAGAGPEPRDNPLENPPPHPHAEPGLPEGRYSTPTIVNHSFRLRGIASARLAPLVGQAVKVSGDIAVEGYPSGDVPARRPSVPLNPPMNVTSLEGLKISCAALVQSR